MRILCARVRTDAFLAERRSGALPDPVAPPELADRLRVTASQEQQAVGQTHGSHLRFLWNRWKFRLDEIMRPLTIPATGGLLSSFLLFGALAFMIGTRSPVVGYEVPVIFAEHTDANLVPVELRSSVVLTLSLDGNGRITDYAVQDGVGLVHRRYDSPAIERYCASGVLEYSRACEAGYERHQHLVHADRLPALSARVLKE